jgi:hypothetical protein
MFQRETTESVKRPLIEHMARFSAQSSYYAEMVEQEFLASPNEFGVRKNILAALGDGPLFGKLQASLSRERIVSEMMGAGVARGQQGLFGDIIMTNGPTFNGPVNAANLVFGDMIGSANNAIQNIGSDRTEEREILGRIMNLIESDKSISSSQRDEIAGAVTEVAKTGDLKAKASLYEKLKTTVTLVGAAATFTRAAEMIMPHVHAWLK